MRVCLLCTEMFGVGHFGGFGRATRMIGRELVRRGVVVTSVVPRRSRDWPDAFELDGMLVRQVPATGPRHSLRALREIEADLFHSQEPSTLTFLAQHAQPSVPSVITFRDPMDWAGWWGEIRRSRSKLGVSLYAAYTDNPAVRRAVQRASRHYCAAPSIGVLAQRKYRLEEDPAFLPSPVDVPESVRKADRPTVCLVGRWHPRKRPELFFELARSMPEVRFIAVGGAQDSARDRHLRTTYGGIENLEMPGPIDQFASDELSSILSESWILVNCSSREGLPTTFVEAAGHGCAILSCVDADDFAGRFGRTVEPATLREGLESLLEDGRWRALGAAGRRYVGEVFATPRSIALHLDAYNEILAEDAGSKLMVS